MSIENIWYQKFQPKFIKNNGWLILNDADIPYPPQFKPDQKYRSNVVFPPGGRGGDHYHSTREEVFVGLGTGMTLIIEDPDIKKTQEFHMDPSFHTQQCISFWIPSNLPHAVENRGDDTGFLVELASHKQEKVEYKLSK